MDTPQPEGAVADHEVETNPPALIEKTGVALVGDYPANHRLRAEALATAKLDKDPDGLITDDLIADAAKRLDVIKETSPLAGSVKDLGKHLESIKDPAELTRLRTEEVAGQNRSSALDAIDARVTALATATI